MRSRGSQIADIAILVVAADDSVKPQTVEAINQIKNAEIPLIVAANKIDLPHADLDRVKKDLAKASIQVEGFGGDVPLIPISAKTGAGIPALLDMIVLVATTIDLSTNPDQPYEAVVIENHLHIGRGMLASVIVKNGMLRIGQSIYQNGQKIGRIRAIRNEFGQQISEAEAGLPVEIMGLETFPAIGAVVRPVAVFSQKPSASDSVKVKDASSKLPDFLSPQTEVEVKKLKVVLKADTAGTLEAITNKLNEQIVVVSKGIGNISKADVLFAKTTGSIIIGFNVKAGTDIEIMAEREKVVFRTYKLIYELLDNLADVVENINELTVRERELGQGTIIAEFPYNDTMIAGTRVTSGRLSRGDRVKVMHEAIEIAACKIVSIRQGKEQVNRVETGSECGVLFDKKVDFAINDVIIAITLV
ncbi:hypothetical protein A2154_04615 [Candidatus Gottesmanbacteria bacterium RBG_16_43_7]|uniref:Tr-type G domain-containing protein n=1 Tax=Candidatus Gottesmanbacteria bacterium RBG_16_43_7 TaxID=1798373 RepID=A0A1F5ZC66_9BACT|nr:MAG: hypothetical protein A2154_04615 [Candidatus Gottesmanbacteria bacterium RBG_16_43_7]